MFAWFHGLSHAELVLLGLALQWLLSAVAHSLPAPDVASGKSYRFAFNFVQFLVSNFSLMRKGAPPPG